MKMKMKMNDMTISRTESPTASSQTMFMFRRAAMWH